ncbi:hypothetical protein ABEF95_003016 [Exophiala dermatitidis]
MSNEQDKYRPRSPDLSGFNAPPPRLSRIPSYSYTASPFFSPQSAAPSPSYFSSRDHSAVPHQAYPPPTTPRTPSIPTQAPLPSHSPHLPPSFDNPYPLHYSQQQPQFQAPRPFTGTQIHQHPPQQFAPPYPGADSFHDMARTRQRKAAEDAEFAFNQNHHANAVNPIKTEQAQAPPRPPTNVANDPSLGIDVRTKFPVARIKRIMQADEDVGKVAQATPTAVSKALELFMITLVTKGAAEARANSSKRVTAQHLKAALMKDSQFDFLTEICENVPDEGSKKGRAKSEAKSEDSDEEIVAKRKGKTRKRKASSDDDTD